MLPDLEATGLRKEQMNVTVEKEGGVNSYPSVMVWDRIFHLFSTADVQPFK